LSGPPSTSSASPRRPAPEEARPRRIHRLDERTVLEIAAGEVIERPASVVKELVENALDAGATSIRVRVEEGGSRLLEVADDGSGIVEEDLPLAFERHATSKLEDAQALPEVRTLGFRGEALASIAAVARVRLATRTGADAEARELEVEGGRLGPVRPAARSRGTTVEVRDLFFNTPARRKFLKSSSTETLRITETIEGLYLAHPEVALTLVREGGEEVRYPSSRSLREAAARVFGPSFLPLAFEFQGAVGPGLWAEGVASHPSFSRGSPRGIVVVVDGRVIASKGISDSLRFAYREVLPQGRYPVIVLRLRTDPGRVDVNVHPTKKEVRFEREGELREALQLLVRSRLRDQPRGAPLGEGKAAGSPPLAFEPFPPSGSALRSAPGAAVPPFAGSERQRTPPLEELLGSSERPPGSSGTSWVSGTSVHPSLLVLGLVGNLYIVAESQGAPKSLVLIDAHAASERILYERLRSSEPPARQELLEPVDLELTPRQKEALGAYAGELERIGFVVEPFGRSVHRVRAVPFFRGHRARADAVLGLLDELADGGRGTPGDPLREKVAKSAACHMAVRGGDSLSLPEMQRLLAELYACPENFTCPHGRPIVLSLPRDRIDRWFLRP
jgi:DNA mismatch repair protein MutL